MKLVLVVVLLLLSLTSAKSIECLLEDNVTDKCLKEVSRQPMQSAIADYLCEIALQRSLLEQAETFCRAGYDEVTEYRYFKVLLLRSKFEEAFKVEYNRFFGNPFKHTSIISDILSEVDPALPNSEEVIESLPIFSRSIFYFYTNQTHKSLTLLKQHLKLNKGDNKMIY